jgi:hypothetical protein
MQKERDLSFSKREKQLILESLLYCVSLDLNHTQYNEELEEMKQLAIKIRMANQKIPIDNIHLSSGHNYSSPHTMDVLSFFPEITKI